MEQNKDTIDLEDILLRALNIYNKSYDFYSISKKNIGRRKKLKQLRLLKLFPSIGKIIKNRDIVNSLSNDDYLKNIFYEKNEDDNKLDKRNVELLIKDIQNVYNEYFKEKSSQKGGSSLDDPTKIITNPSDIPSSEVTTETPSEEKKEIKISVEKEDTPNVDSSNTAEKKDPPVDIQPKNLKNNVKKIIGAVCKENIVTIENITLLLAGQQEINLYELITGEDIKPELLEPFKQFCSKHNICVGWTNENFNSFFKKNSKDDINFNRHNLYLKYNLNLKLSGYLKEIFPPNQSLIEHLTPTNSLKRISAFLRLFSEYEDIIINIVQNIIRLKKEGVNNPFVHIVEIFKSLVSGLNELKTTVSDLVVSVKFILNTVGLIGTLAGSVASVGYTASAGVATGVHEVLGVVNILRIIIDFFSPLVTFFSLIILRQDELAAEVLISNYPLFLEMPVNIAYSIISVISQGINMKNLCMILELTNTIPTVPSTPGLDISLDNIYSELQITSHINLNKYSITHMKIIDNIKNKIINNIMCQLIDVLSFEGLSILLNAGIQNTISSLYNIFINILNKIEEGYDIVSSPVRLNILRLLFGMKYTDHITQALVAPILTKKIINKQSPENMNITSENLDNLKIAFSELKMGGILGPLVNLFSKNK